MLKNGKNVYKELCFETPKFLNCPLQPKYNPFPINLSFSLTMKKLLIINFPKISNTSGLEGRLSLKVRKSQKRFFLASNPPKSQRKYFAYLFPNGLKLVKSKKWKSFIVIMRREWHKVFFGSNVSPISFITSVPRYPWVSHSFKTGWLVRVGTFECWHAHTHRPL